MKVNLKDHKLKIEELETEKFYVGSSGSLFYLTTMYIDNIMEDKNFRYLFISLGNKYGNKMYEDEESLWNLIGTYNLRKAEFEINEI